MPHTLNPSFKLRVNCVPERAEGSRNQVQNQPGVTGSGGQGENCTREKGVGSRESAVGSGRCDLGPCGGDRHPQCSKWSSSVLTLLQASHVLRENRLSKVSNASNGTSLLEQSSPFAGRAAEEPVVNKLPDALR